MNINRIRLLASGLLAALIGAQPLCTLVVNASTDQISTNAQSRMIAARMGVDELMLQDTAAYQARELEQERIQHDAALAELNRANTPSPENLAAAKAQASAVKTAHATASFAGTVNTVTDIGAGLSRFEAGLSAGQASTTSRAVFKAYAVQVSSALDSLSRMTDAERARIAPADAQAHTRLNAFENHMQLALRQLQHELAAMPDEAAGASTWQTYAAHVTAALDSAGLGAPRAPAKPAPAPFGELRANARALPANRADYVAADPSFTAAALLQDYMNHPAHLDSLLSALSQIQGVFKSASTGPTPADLVETPDIHFTPRLQALSNSLGSALSMFTYVRDNVDSELYYGSKKGSTGALYEMGGNDADQASLLIALLRSANIPAHYAIGTVRLSSQQAMDLARTQTVASAANTMGTAGIPALIETVNGVPQYVDIQHVWVQAWLPYERYRGVFEKPAASAWIDLDPFVKTYAFNTPVNLTSAAPFNAAAYLSGPYTHTLPLDYWENGLRSYVQANGLDCTTLDAAMRFRAILPGNLELLPSQLPVTPLIVYGTPSSLNSTQRYTLQVALQDEFGATSLSYNAELPAIYGQRIDLSYVPATVADQTTINNAGGLLKTPPYLVHLVPSLNVSETVVASGAPVVAGTAGSLQVSFTTPGIASDVPDMSHAVTAGGLYVVGLDYQSVPQQLVDEAQVRNAALAPTSANAQAQKLWITLLDYFREVNRGRDQSAGILQTWYVRDLGAGYASQEMRADTLYGSPVALHDNGVQVDVPKLTFDFYDLEDGGQARSFAVKQIFGFNTSALEHTIIQKEFNQEGISAVKALQLAALAGQTLITVTNASQLTPLGVSQGAKDGILNALNRGWQAIVSQNPVALYKWHGEGYIVYDPVLGSAGYIISGGLNGGSGTGGGSGGSSGGKGGGTESPDQQAQDVADSIGSWFNGVAGDPVNLSNGNLTLSAHDLMVREPFLPIGLLRYYNSIDAASSPSRFGFGWTDSFSTRIAQNLDGTLSLITANGHEYIYTPAGGGVYTPPDGWFTQLTVTGTGYLTSEGDGSIQKYGPDGRLTGASLSIGVIVTTTYSGNLLTSEIDELGRTALNFAYDASGTHIINATDLHGLSTSYGYDAPGNLVVITDTTGAPTHYLYDDQHRIIQTIDPSGAVNSYEYDADGRLQRNTDPAGHVDSMSYDEYTGRATITDKDGQDTTMTFDEKGNPMTRTDPEGNKTVNKRDANGNLVGAVDSRGNSTSLALDSQGKLISMTDALNQTTTYAYNSHAEVVSSTLSGNGAQVTQQSSYDSQGRLISTTDRAGYTTVYTNFNGLLPGHITDSGNKATDIGYTPDGSQKNITRYLHDADGNQYALSQTFTYSAGMFVQNIVDPSGRTSALTTDAHGNVLVAQSTDKQVNINHDALGHITQIADSSGFTVSMTYDGLGQLTNRSDKSQRSVSYAYTPRGKIASKQDSRGRTSRYLYDPLGRMTQTINPDGSTRGVGYCAAVPAPCKSVDENGNSFSNSIDALGRVVSATDGLAQTSANQYDALDNLIKQVDAAGNATSYQYDGMGHLLSVVDASNHITAYTYDAGGQQSGMTDANGHTRSTQHDELGRVVRKTDPLGNQWRYYFYGSTTQPTKIVDANGQVLNYAYDSMGKTLSLNGPQGIDTYTYQPDGKLSTESNANSTLAYRYDDVGRVISTTQLMNSVTRTALYTYNIDGQITSITDAEGGVWHYDYDNMDRLSTITSADGHVTTFSYDPGGRRIRLALPNGVTVYYTYDSADRLKAEVARNASNTIVAAFSYTYDATGHITAMTDYSGQTTTYTYDPLYRLTSVTYGNGKTQSFSYDKVGNRLTQVANGINTTYTYNIGDRLTSELTAAGTTNYSYDNNGNLINKTDVSGSTSMTYTQINQLKSLLIPGGNRWDFGYTPGHVRAFQIYSPPAGSTERTDFLLLGQSTLADYVTKNASTTVTHYLLSLTLDELLGQETGGNWTYFVTDKLGSASVATDATGQVVGRRTYDAFGATQSSQGTWPTRFGFTGREDIGASGLLHYRMRTYDPQTGRFTSVDPAAGISQIPQSYHPYTYAVNDPVNLTDPTGETVFTNHPFLDYLFFTAALDYAKFLFFMKCVDFECMEARFLVTFIDGVVALGYSIVTMILNWTDWGDIDMGIMVAGIAWIVYTIVALIAEFSVVPGSYLPLLVMVDRAVIYFALSLALTWAIGWMMRNMDANDVVGQAAKTGIFGIVEGIKYSMQWSNVKDLGAGVLKLLMTPELDMAAGVAINKARQK